MCSLPALEDPASNTCLILIDLELIHGSVSGQGVVDDHGSLRVRSAQVPISAVGNGSPGVCTLGPA
jgi:hypothetical protein